jgi:1-acyl-sn-glycerol-3-phosphate acyltransferase
VPPLAPRGFLNEVVYNTIQLTFRLVLRWGFHLSLADVRPEPADGPLILAANHCSYLDPLVLGASFERRVFYVMQGRYYDKPVLNWFFRVARCICVDDERDNRQALRESKRVLDGGQVLGIFPEGHISPDGSLQEAQGGMAWLARKTGARVIPVHIGGTRRALTRGRWRLRPSVITVRSSAPMSIAGYPDDRAGNEAFARDVMAEIARLGRLPPARRRAAHR